MKLPPNFNSESRVFITGITGQMGSYLTDIFLDNNIRVWGGVRRLSCANYRNIRRHLDNPNLKIVSFDLGDAHSIRSAIESAQPGYFFNCAANSFVGSSWDFPEQHMIFNAIGVLHELEAIRKYAPFCRYVNFGSSEEFGDVIYTPQNESHPPRARSPYGASKVAARQLVKVYRESYNLYALQCWCFNYESPRRGEEFVTRKISKGMSRIKLAMHNGSSFEPIKVGNLDAKRDWSHARDIAEGVILMLSQPCDKNLDLKIYGYANDSIRKLREFVFSSGKLDSIRTLVELAANAAKLHGHWEGNGMEEKFVTNNGAILLQVDPRFFRPNEVQSLCGDPSRAQSVLKWNAQTPFADIMDEMVHCDLMIPQEQPGR